MSRSEMIRFALILMASGAGILGGLGYAWVTGREWVVFTIMPMMGTPYIIGAALLFYGAQGLCIESYDWLRGVR